jgi:hypothetical protein
LALGELWINVVEYEIDNVSSVHVHNVFCYFVLNKGFVTKIALFEPAWDDAVANLPPKFSPHFITAVPLESL